MSYEILYKYHEKKEDGEYNRDETKEKTVKVGKPYEITSLEEVAGRVIAQLARRNILIVGVEICEYTKKKISYSETEDGIKIKGRKFSFDETGVVTTSEPEGTQQEQLLEILQANPALVQQLLGQQPAKPNGEVIPRLTKPALTSAPLRHEVFEPVDETMLKVAAQKGWKFTRGKRYPILKERPASGNPMDGMMYTTTDDEGKSREINDKYFTIPPKLTESFIEDSVGYVGASEYEPQLSYGGGASVKADMPDLSMLRGRK
jgi:hypothetical protein